ncbi:alpha/beta hydrolase [Flavobacterium sp. F-380]|uniref:Alpha/beta hydrolase n=1 Tax=Flavobacterium kayseriense TaxID=2764714 RepID=A0ABR7J4Q8_9FLAO|nr:alpha/beta hydrolase [Flavobacterium kayseriense]MBC5840505.1 alpha/beta hydrolase [Flavobacterium kayseriense]MBC5846825.1 alpha/beta hydrolase [Flavobacterium kayseriense]
MKTKFLILSLLSMQFLFAQEITGSWSGELNVQGMSLPLIIHIKKDVNGFSSTMDSPKQGATNIPLGTTTFVDNQLAINAPALGLSYSGKFNADTFEGTFKQGGMELPMTLSRQSEAIKTVNRPQTPKGPFDYEIEEVSFTNTIDKNTLAGTLTTPKNFNKKAPILIMITGSGNQNRDEELFDHKPFAVIADNFAKKGIATLRIDDRGIGGSSKGTSTDTSANFATDIDAAVLFIKNKGFTNIGLIGHSEGGMIAPMVATNSKNVRFLVLMAAPATPIDELLVEQNYLAGKLAGMSEEKLLENKKINKNIYSFIMKYTGSDYEKDLRSFLEKEGQLVDEAVLSQMKNPWLLYFLKFNPDTYLSKVTIPVLAINGSLDFQVPATTNLAAIKNSLTKAKNKNFETFEFKGMNHLFQECKTGAFTEYEQIKQTVSPQVLDKMSSWILKL